MLAKNVHHVAIFGVGTFSVCFAVAGVGKLTAFSSHLNDSYNGAVTLIRVNLNAGSQGLNGPVLERHTWKRPPSRNGWTARSLWWELLEKGCVSPALSVIRLIESSTIEGPEETYRGRRDKSVTCSN